MHRRLLAALVLLVAVVPDGASAQDVEMLGRRYGTTPPASYYAELARNPDAFRFARGRAARMRAAAELRAQRRGAAGPAGVDATGPAAAGLGPRDGPVVGTISVPVVLGLFDDSPATPPVTQSQIQTGYFGAQAGTVTDYYREVSNDSVTLVGDVQDWVRSSMTRSQATYVNSEGGNASGLGCCGIGDYIKTLLDSLQAGVDWGTYDNDGPDGVPNSGDDDGYVDALAVVHPTAGDECPGDNPDRIWSHKWTLTDASSGRTPYATSTPSNASGVPFVRVDDYFVQGAVNCAGTALNEIGVFTHEAGHAFGLPDLYDTRAFGAHDGAGSWDLMASGTWGCSGTTPYSPCHMGAWSKAMLGWVTVDTLPPDTDFGTLTLPPVETSGVVYRVDAADGSNEYFLIENRQRDVATYDQMLPAEGLLIWQIDAGVVDARWAQNTVNSHDHMGVWLRQADGLDELGFPGGDRGDSGDPFPGATGNTAFHAATNPAARSYQGTATGLSMLEIVQAGEDMTFRLLTRFTSMPDLVVDLVATVFDSVQLTVQSGTPPISWSAVGGSTPDGLVLRSNGWVAGAPVDLGLFPLSVEATDALGLTAKGTVTFDVTEPTLVVAEIAAPFLLSAQPIDSVQALFLDRQGNDDGAYDLGDLRAWVLAHPSLPLSVELGQARRGEQRIRLPLSLSTPGAGR